MTTEHGNSVWKIDYEVEERYVTSSHVSIVLAGRDAQDAIDKLRAFVLSKVGVESFTVRHLSLVCEVNIL